MFIHNKAWGSWAAPSENLDFQNLRNAILGHSEEHLLSLQLLYNGILFELMMFKPNKVGVWRHAPPEKIRFSGPQKRHFREFWRKLAVVTTLNGIFYNNSLTFYLEG